MAAKELMFNTEARAKLKRGVDALAEASTVLVAPLYAAIAATVSLSSRITVSVADCSAVVICSARAPTTAKRSTTSGRPRFRRHPCGAPAPTTPRTSSPRAR